MQKIIPDIIHKSQSAYIKTRYIGDNAQLVNDIIDYSEKYETPGIILSLDIQKAFDTIEWNFMYKSIEKFNFGKNLINWIGILYKDANVVIKNNGYFTKKTFIERGLRQGCLI